MIVMKFGGTSLADTEHITRVAGIVAAARARGPIVVASAMAGVTDQLMVASEHAARSDLPAARSIVDELRVRHATALSGTADGTEAGARARPRLATLFEELNHTLDALALVEARGARAIDAVVALGESLSTTVLVAALETAGLSAELLHGRDMVITDGTFGRAQPDFPEITQRAQARVAPLVEAGTVPVIPGFVGATREGVTTTLGRGGSDFTASLLAAALAVDEVEIWTDVHGLMTADPRVVPAARPLMEATYDEAAELAHFGAKVLHPATMIPLIDAGIPLRIRNSRDPDAPGTRISADPGRRPGTVKSIASKCGVTTVSLQAPRMLGAHGFLRNVLDLIDRHGVAVDVVATSEVSVSFSIEKGVVTPKLMEDLARMGEVHVNHNRAIICVVGEALRETPGIAARIFKAIASVNVQMISMGASKINVTIVVSDAQAAETVTRLHAAFFPD